MKFFPVVAVRGDVVIKLMGADVGNCLREFFASVIWSSLSFNFFYPNR